MNTVQHVHANTRYGARDVASYYAGIVRSNQLPVDPGRHNWETNTYST